MSRSFPHMPEAERRKWQDSKTILSEIGLKPDDTFVDIGCGEGYFTLAAARVVGEKGIVYGIDIDEDAINRLQQSYKKEDLKNIILIVGDAETTVFCNRCADIVFLGIDLHDFRDPSAVLKNARKMLKADGKLVDLDWKKEPAPFGPPVEIRFDEAKATMLIEGAGFKIESVKPEGLHHYLIIAKALGEKHESQQTDRVHTRSPGQGG